MFSAVTSILTLTLTAVVVVSMVVVTAASTGITADVLFCFGGIGVSSPFGLPLFFV